MSSSRQDLDSEEQRANDPEPRESEYHRGCLIVHWRGYVKDSEPTARRRAEGRSVIVYDDNQDELFLRPTGYPSVPEPWASRCLKYAVAVPEPMCGGRPGRRFLTNGHWQCVVDEATFAGAVAQGWRDVGDHWYGSDDLITRRFFGCRFSEPVPLTDLQQTTIRIGEPYETAASKIGDVWINSMESMPIASLTPRSRSNSVYSDINGQMRVVVPGVAVVSGLRGVPESAP
jgi:hypothetical protein